MKALCFDHTGSPDQVLRLKDVLPPKPRVGEILVRVMASSINPADFLFIEGKYAMVPHLPQIAGLDGVGVVLESVGRFTKGGRIAFRHPGAWAEEIAVPVGSTISLPADFPVDKGAQFILNPGTAWGLLDKAGLKAGDWLLLTAGNSMISKIVSQMAHKRGIHVICTVRDRSRVQDLKEFGAKEVIDLASTGDSLAEKIQQVTLGKGVSAVFDSVGGPHTSQLLKAIGPGGVLILYGVLSGEPVCFHNSTVIYKQLRIESFRIASYIDQLPDKQSVFERVAEEIRPPSFRMDTSGTFTLERFADALQSAKEGKVLFLVNPAG